MTPKHRRGSGGTQEPFSPYAEREERHAPGAVRIVPKPLTPHPDAPTRRPDAGRHGATPATVRPTHLHDITEVARTLRTRTPVILQLDGLGSDSDRGRAIDLITGIAYGLDTTVSTLDPSKPTMLLEPRDATVSARRDPSPAADDAKPETAAGQATAPRCALCDLRPAAFDFRSPVDTVLLRDGSRVWSPPVSICNFCRATVRHWRFVVAWCPQCERWGRRSVMSPCGIPYGF